MSRKLFTLLAIPALLTAGLLSAAPASAATDAMQDQVDAVVAEHGGVQTGANEISWDGGTVILTLAPEGISALAVGNCPSGSFCAYSGLSYGGSRMQFTACTSGNSVAALGTVRSIANSRTAGTVRAYDGGALIATLAPNTGRTSVAAGIDTLSCS